MTNVRKMCIRDRRHTVCGLGGKVNGVPREDGFDITVASEVMAILCFCLLYTSFSKNSHWCGPILKYD